LLRVLFDFRRCRRLLLVRSRCPCPSICTSSDVMRRIILSLSGYTAAVVSG
jgi:hypothetical protein